jgi:NADH-quinone oxidoreductase subunit N
MNLAAFAVIVARERETRVGDDISSLYGLGAERPWLAWPMTLAMLALAGLPGTAGFFGKLFLIEAAVDNEYAWLGVVIVLGSAISLVYYLRVLAAVWMRSPSDVPVRGRAAAVPAGAGPGRPAIAGGSPEADAEDDRPGSHAAGGGGGGDAPGARAAGGGDITRRETGDTVAVTVEDDGPRERRVRQPEVALVAVVCALLTFALGIYPDPLLDVARDAGAAIAGLV